MIDENSYRTTIDVLKRMRTTCLENRKSILDAAIAIVEVNYYVGLLSAAMDRDKTLKEKESKETKTNEDSSDRPSAGETGKDADRGSIRAEHPEEHPVPMGERQEECGGVHATEAG